MSAEALKLLESRLTRLRHEHERELLSAGASAMNTFDSMKKVSYGFAIAEYMRLADSALADYEQKVRGEITTLTEQLLTPLTAEIKGELLALAERQFDKELYPKRFTLFVEGLGRSIGRSGQPASDWGIDSALDAARHQAGTSSHIYRSLARLSDDLQLIRLRAPAPKKEGKLEEVNRVLKLEPNFFGFGINLNYLIRRLWRRRE